MTLRRFTNLGRILPQEAERKRNTRVGGSLSFITIDSIARYYANRHANWIGNLLLNASGRDNILWFDSEEEVFTYLETHPLDA